MKSHKNTLSTSLIIGIVAFYRYALKPFVFETCLFHPTCSVYMMEAIRQRGWAGLWMGLKRLGRCHPWGRVRCFHDPVPPLKRS